MPPLNWDELCHRCMNSVAFAERLLASFEKRYPQEWEAVLAALQAGDSAETRRLVHQLKGTAANICATELRQTMQELEEQIQSGKPVASDDWRARVDEQWRQFRDYRATLRNAPEPVASA